MKLIIGPIITVGLCEYGLQVSYYQTFKHSCFSTFIDSIQGKTATAMFTT